MMNCAMIEEQVARLRLPDLEDATTSTWGQHNRIRNGCTIIQSGKTTSRSQQDTARIAADLHIFYMNESEEAQQLWQQYLQDCVQYLTPATRQEYRIAGARGQPITGNISVKGINDLRQTFSTWFPAPNTPQSLSQQEISFNWQESSIEYLNHIHIGDVKVQPGSWLLSREGTRDTSMPLQPPQVLWFVKVKTIIQHCRRMTGEHSATCLYLVVDWYRSPEGRAWDVELQSPLVQTHIYAGHSDKKSSIVKPCRMFPLHVGVVPHPGRLLVNGEPVYVALTRTWHALQADLLPVPWQPLL